MIVFNLLVACLFACCVHGEFIHKESMNQRHDFVLHSRADLDAEHEVIFAIKQLNLDVLEKKVLEMSTPGSETYQKWMTFDEVGSLTANPEAFEVTVNWLEKQHNIKPTWVSRRKEYFKATATVKTWETVFNTTFFNWKDQNPQVADFLKDKLAIRARHFSLPQFLHEHVDTVFNTVQAWPVINKKYHRKDEDVSFRTDFQPNLRRVKEVVEKMTADGSKLDLTLGESVTTVNFLNLYYAIPDNLGSGALNQSVFETSNEYYSPNDLALFQQTYNLTNQTAYDIGGFQTNSCNANNNCDEGNLDIQYIMGMAQNTGSIYWYVSSTGGDPFVSWVTAIADEANPPLANSMSWGTIEQQQPTSVLNSFNTEALKLSSMGVTVTVSSGDDGVSNFNCECTNSSGSSQSSWTGAGSWTGTGYFPSFPATCPYVTAVGATMGSNGRPPDLDASELACQSQLGGVITSGGGFSTYFAQPSWQTAAVNNYFLGLANQPSSGYNRNGRGYPDVAFVGVYYQVMLAGSLISLFGTSCSSPLTSAMVSLINAARAVKSLPSIGYMNPTLYANQNLFNDVTSGSNNCCAYSGSNPSQATCCNSGFTAAKGWDPVTGLGSITYGNFSTIWNVNTTVCGSCSDLCIIVPDTNNYPCYQGTPVNTAECFASDPLLDPHGFTWHCGLCSDYGYDVYDRNDPIYTEMELWIKH